MTHAATLLLLAPWLVSGACRYNEESSVDGYIRLVGVGYFTRQIDGYRGGSDVSRRLEGVSKVATLDSNYLIFPTLLNSGLLLYEMLVEHAFEPPRLYTNNDGVEGVPGRSRKGSWGASGKVHV